MNKVTALAHQVMDDHARSDGQIPRSRRQLAQKVILLDKAHRWQRAANMLLVEMINSQQRFYSSKVSPWGFSNEKHNATMEKLSQKRAWVMATASDIYQQAAKI